MLPVAGVNQCFVLSTTCAGDEIRPGTGVATACSWDLWNAEPAAGAKGEHIWSLPVFNNLPILTASSVYEAVGVWEYACAWLGLQRGSSPFNAEEEKVEWQLLPCPCRGRAGFERGKQNAVGSAAERVGCATYWLCRCRARHGL